MVDDDSDALANRRATRGSVFFRAHMTQLALYIGRQFTFMSRSLLANINASPIIKLVIVEVLRQMQQNSSMEKYRDEFAAAFICNSQYLSDWWAEDGSVNDLHLDAIELIGKLMLLAPSPKYSTELPEFKPIFEMFVRYITEKPVSLARKSKLLSGFNLFSL